MMKKAGCIVAFLACALTTSVLTGCGGPTTVTAAPAEHVITVSATSEVKAVPDTARFDVSVTTQGKDAQSVQADNADAVKDVLAALNASGVAEEDVQTAYTDLYPTYGGLDDSDFGQPEIVGYEMDTRLQVSGVSVDEVGALMEACVEAGATGVDGPQYYADSYDELYDQALEAAVADARAKAETLADAGGVKLGEVASITEGYQDTSYRYATGDVAYAEAASEDAQMKVAPGQISIEATVTVSYAIS